MKLVGQGFLKRDRFTITPNNYPSSRYDITIEEIMNGQVNSESTKKR